MNNADTLPSSITDYVYKELEKNADLQNLIHQNRNQTVREVLNVHMGRKQMGTTVVFEQAGLNSKYGFRVMNGQREPSRDVLLRLAFVLGLSCSETQYLLKCGGQATLSGQRSRDVVLMKALMDRMDLMKAEELLIQMQMEPLISK